MFLLHKIKKLTTNHHGKVESRVRFPLSAYCISKKSENRCAES